MSCLWKTVHVDFVTVKQRLKNQAEREADGILVMIKDQSIANTDGTISCGGPLANLRCFII